MKIVILHNAYPQYGGEDTVVANETAMLARYGHEVVPFIVPTEESGLMNLIRCGLSAVWNPFSARKLKSFLLQEKPDIVHCHNTFPLLSPSVFAACHSAGIPVVQTIHNYRHICPAGGFFRDGEICEECIGKRFPAPALKHQCYRKSRIASMIPTLTAYAQRVRRTFDRDVDVLIALNQFGKQKLVEGGLPADRIVIKPNFCPEPASSNSYPRSNEKRFTVCFAGRFSIDKGIQVLLSAWVAFAESLDEHQKTRVCLRIAGGGELETLVSKTAAKDPTIQYEGSLSHEATLAMIEQSDALVCPSLWYEGMPMTLLEAFSAGRPVIASEIGGLPEMVRHGANGLLFSPGDGSQLASCFNMLFSSGELRREMGGNAHRIYESYYTEKANFPLLDKIYTDAIQTFRKQKNHTL
jgi:glycosyltransferase involved in cell wall biosynthesis